MGRCLKKHCRGTTTEVELPDLAVRSRARSRSSLSMAAAAGSSGTIRKVAGSKEIIRCGDSRRFEIGDENCLPNPNSKDHSSVGSCVEEVNWSRCCYGDDDIGAVGVPFSASCCSSSGSTDERQRVQYPLPFPDPEEVEEDDDEFVDVTKAILNSNYCRKRRETTPLSECEVESTDAMDATAMKPSSESESYGDSRRRSSTRKMPSNSEIEEFFSVAEKDMQKRFIDKYNFDIVKDVPLEGRYQWVPVKP